MIQVKTYLLHLRLVSYDNIEIDLIKDTLTNDFERKNRNTRQLILHHINELIFVDYITHKKN